MEDFELKDESKDVLTCEALDTLFLDGYNDVLNLDKSYPEVNKVEDGVERMNSLI